MEFSKPIEMAGGKSIRLSADSPTARRAYSIKEVCQLCGFSRAWLYLEWKGGGGPARFKIGTRTLVRAEALEVWLKSLEQFTSANRVGA